MASPLAAPAARRNGSFSTFVIEPAGVNSGFCWRSTFWQNSYYMSYTCVLLHDLYILLHRGEAVPMHQCLHLLQSEF